MNRRDFLVRSTLAAAGWGLAARSLRAADTAPAPAPAPAPPPPAVTFTPLRGGVGLATGRGGTMGWLVTADAVVAVDSQFPETARLFIDGLPGRDGRGFDLLVNTHHHADHTGGNAVFRPVARSIVAHAHVPALQRGRSKDPAREVVADTTFTDQWRRDFGAETVHGRHFGPAHTKGDIAVHFERANVTHLGDLLFNRWYPVIDRPGGASIRGWIERLETIAKTYPADTLYVFGHGNPKFGVSGTAADLGVMRDYLAALLERVEREIRAGRTREQIVAAENFDAFPDFHQAPPNRFAANLGVAYDELTDAPAG